MHYGYDYFLLQPQVQVKGQFHEQCVRLCRQDIATLSQCLTAFAQNSH